VRRANVGQNRWAMQIAVIAIIAAKWPRSTNAAANIIRPQLKAQLRPCRAPELIASPWFSPTRERPAGLRRADPYRVGAPTRRDDLGKD
jgi:hypothetical protein